MGPRGTFLPRSTQVYPVLERSRRVASPSAAGRLSPPAGGGRLARAAVSTRRRRPPESGGRFLRLAALASLRRSLPVSGGGRGRAATVFCGRQPFLEGGNGFLGAATLARNWQRLPLSRIQCHGLASVASLPNPMPWIEKRCRFPESNAMELRGRPPCGAPPGPQEIQEPKRTPTRPGWPGSRGWRR